jgi:hypothetical protein
MSRLDSKPQIGKLASDLGLKATGRPVSEIVEYVRRRVGKVVKNYKCTDLASLLGAAAHDAKTIIREVHCDADLDQIIAEFVPQGERIFANLRNELRDHDYAITLKRQHAAKFDLPFVSVIDCRGPKMFASYFTKWHELAHLFTLTPQMRLVFRRTHAAAVLDPEESLMDIIAGEMAFWPAFLNAGHHQDISFDLIERIRNEFCPQASYQASLIGIVKALPKPCILLSAQLDLKKSEKFDPLQMRLSNCDAPSPQLRAVHVSVNRAARDENICMHPHWRVPERSAIYRSFEQRSHFEAVENLDWWATSSGSRLRSCTVLVKARYSPESVTALLIPTSIDSHE